MRYRVHLFLPFVLAMLIATPAAAATVPSLNADDTAVTYQTDRLHDGATSASLTLPLHVLWTAQLGYGVGYPIIADGRVFVTADQQLVALNAATGKREWTQTTTSSYGWVGAAYDRGKVFAQASLVFSGAGLFAFGERSGHQIWSAPLPGQYLFSSAPTVFNGMVYTGGAGSGGTVYALRETDGSLVWTQGVANGDDSSPVVTRDAVYVSYACPQTYKFNALTGAPIWQFSGPCEGGGGSTGVLYNRALYVEDSFINSHNGVILNATNGHVIAYFDSAFTPAFANDIGYFIQNGNSSLTAIDTQTGMTLWSATANTNDSFVMPALVSTSLGVVFEATSHGLFVGYNAMTGKQVVSMTIGTPAGGTAMAAGPNLIVVPDGTALIALGH